MACWSRLIEGDPEASLARDAHLQIAAAWDEAASPRRAALAYRRFSDTYPADSESANALWKAAELLASDGDVTQAESLRLEYVARFPEDVETVMNVLSELALRELEGVGPERPISSLLGEDGEQGSEGYLASYLALAETHAEFASVEIQARAAYLRGEEAQRACTAVPLAQPLDAAIRERRGALERTLAAYRRCAEVGATAWTRAAGFRMGEVLVNFGDALLASERPGDLTVEEIDAYEAVLEDEAWKFYDAGEAIWGELLERGRSLNSDPGEWIARTRQALWPRLAQRFLYRPEVEYPRIAATPPDPGAEGVRWAESILGIEPGASNTDASVRR